MERGKVDLSTFEISWYDVGASRLKRIAWYFTNVLFFMNPLFPFVGIKPKILRWFGAEVGKRVVFHTNVNIKYPWKLSIGDYCWIGEGVWIDNLDQVSIGNHVVISQGALILGGDHNYKKTDFPTELGEIVLEDGCWIGAKAVVTRRVTVGSHALLTVGSMASKDLEPYGIYQGNPAVKVRERVIG
jgi:putative colanic acid biosynthesis acetyltransferase WcaF